MSIHLNGMLALATAWTKEKNHHVHPARSGLTKNLLVSGSRKIAIRSGVLEIKKDAGIEALASA